MAGKTEKDTAKETVATEKSVPSKKTRVRMTRTYIGEAGCFYAGQIYESDEKILSEFLKNKDAVEC